MEIETVEISTLVPDPENVRIHSVKNMMAITASLQEFGQQIPLVVGAGNIVLKGNGSLACMKQMGWKQCYIHRTNLAGASAIHFAVADNRSAELAEWNLEQLSINIQKDEDYATHLLKHGWTNAEIEPLRLAEWNPDEPLPVMPGTTSVAPLPSLFIDLNGADLAALATPLALWREHHPSIADSTDAQVLVAIAEQWVRWHKRGMDEHGH